MARLVELSSGDKPTGEKLGALGEKSGVLAVEKSNYKKSRVYTTRLFANQLCELSSEESLPETWDYCGKIQLGRPSEKMRARGYASSIVSVVIT